MPTGIPWSAIVAYGKHHGLDKRMIDDMVDIILKADSKWRAKVVELRKREMERNRGKKS